MGFKSPINIFVVWHPDFIDGKNIANLIFSTFNRNVSEPLSRGIGIPVYFRSIPINSTLPLGINFTEAEYTIIIFLIDNVLTIATDWHSYINKIIETTNSKSLILPIAINKDSYKIPVNFGKINFLRLYNLSGSEREQYLLLLLSHEFCRLIYESDYSLTGNGTHKSLAPIKIFLSHSKHDKFNKGEKLALAIRNYIYSETPMKTFFDVNDIAPGYDFEAEITSNIERMVFLCIHTDTYAKREYCRKEVLTAKNNNRPVIVLKSLDKGEDRSFPYMSNVPTIKINIEMNTCPPISKIDVEFVILKILQETLRFKFQKMYIDHVLLIFKPCSSTSIETIPFPPELLFINNLAPRKVECIVYPDPPLGDEEISILQKVNTNMGLNYDYITPTLIPLKFIEHAG